MKATALIVTADRATVEPRPCWLARKLGARIVTVDLAYDGSRWVTVAGRERLDRDKGRHRRILEALDFRPVAEVPRATLVSESPSPRRIHCAGTWHAFLVGAPRCDCGVEPAPGTVAS